MLGLDHARSRIIGLARQVVGRQPKMYPINAGKARRTAVTVGVASPRSNPRRQVSVQPLVLRTNRAVAATNTLAISRHNVPPSPLCLTKTRCHNSSMRPEKITPQKDPRTKAAASVQEPHDVGGRDSAGDGSGLCCVICRIQVARDQANAESAVIGRLPFTALTVGSCHPGA